MEERMMNAIVERDIDLLVLEEMVSNPDFLSVFVKKLGINYGVEIVSYFHSVMDRDLGESDITVIINNNGKNHALLIENKIDAIAMRNQSGRYQDRGLKGIKNGNFEGFDVFIIAPSKYLESNHEAIKYPNRVSYEEMKEYFDSCSDKRSRFKSQMLSIAIYKQKSSYIIIEHEFLTNFWSEYYKLVEDEFPHLNLGMREGSRGSKSTWFRYKTPSKKAKIIHKCEPLKADYDQTLGYVDLEMKGMYLYIDQVRELLKNIIEPDMKYARSGTSIVIRLRCPRMYPKTKTYIEQVGNIKKALYVVEKMIDFAKKIV